MNATLSRHWDRETFLVGIIAAALSVAALLFCMRHGSVLLFGDAVAHLNIARRVFDSRTPGLLQLGTVWLPLPHLLIIPFVVSLSAWQNGAAASIPSMAAYVLGTIGIFRLVRGTLAGNDADQHTPCWLAYFAAGIYALNPNILYLQSTAMTEPLYLGLFIWAVVFFSEYLQDSNSGSSLIQCGLCVAAAELTRYDGWFLGAALGAAVIALHWFTRGADRKGERSSRPAVLKFVLLIAAAPILWLAYNGAVYGNPLEFANGPYSARAIEQRTSTPGFPPHPGAGHVIQAAHYFAKAGELNLATGKLQLLWIALALAGIAAALVTRRLRPLLLLWLPLPFYALSVAHGSVPIFVPTWWPFSYYNVRYGIQILPAAAVFIALAAWWVARCGRSRAIKLLVFAVAVTFVGASYAAVWHARPICFQEAWVNGRARVALEKALASYLQTLPENSTVLMYLGDHVGALQDAGIPLRRTINEADHRTWKQPSDPEGLWERALEDPGSFADYAVATGSDPVARAVQGKQFDPVAIIHVPGQPAATIYRVRNGSRDHP